MKYTKWKTQKYLKRKLFQKITAKLNKGKNIALTEI